MESIRPGYPPIERKATTFDPEALQRLLDGDQVEIRDRVKQLITQPEFRYYEGTDVEGYRDQVLQWVKQIADAGIGRIGLPRSLGGEENPAKFIAAAETLAFHDFSLVIKLGVQYGLFGGSIQLLGTEYHHKKYLPDCASAKLMGCFAMTEIGHGSNVQALETTATYEKATDTFVINSPTYSAGKTFIGNAGRDGRVATVFAQLEVNGQNHGVHAFLVPVRDDNGKALPGIRIEDNDVKLGLNGVDNGQIWFDHIRIPRIEMLNRFADVTDSGQYVSAIQSPSARFFTMIGTLVGGRVSIAAGSNNVCKSALTIAIRYAARRRQFGSSASVTVSASEDRPTGDPHSHSLETLLLDYPAHQRRLLPPLATVFAIDFALKHLIQQLGSTRTGDRRSFETKAAGIKAFATWNATRTIQTCRECCGGEGYIAANRLAALKADTDICTTFEGDNTVLMQLVAKNLLSKFKEKIKGMQPAQIGRFFFDQKLDALFKQNPIFRRNENEEHLLDSEFHLTIMQFRESAILLSCAQEFRESAKTKDVFSAFTIMQRQMLELAHAYVERVILERFLEAISKVNDHSLTKTLEHLSQLFALSQIESNRAWYLEHGVFSGAKARAITRLVDKLCREVRNEAVALVDSFGIPDSCLAAPIALE
jgi:acyl-CoA oxidase